MHYKKESEQKEVIEDDFDELPELKIADDEDLASLWKSKSDTIPVDDYDPFGDKAFDDYLDKRGQSFKQQSEHFYKPIKPQRRIVSSKELFVAQTVLKDKQKIKKHGTPPAPIKSKSAKSGFRTMKVKTTQKLKTSTVPILNEMTITNNMDEMADIESYILQQNEENNYNSPNGSDDALNANVLATNNLNPSMGMASDPSPNPAIGGLDL
eukprot:UN00900